MSIKYNAPLKFDLYMERGHYGGARWYYYCINIKIIP